MGKLGIWEEFWGRNSNRRQNRKIFGAAVLDKMMQKSVAIRTKCSVLIQK